MWTVALLGGGLLTTAAHAAKPPDVKPWLEAACEVGKEGSRPVYFVLPATTRPPAIVGPFQVQIEVDGTGIRVDGATTAPTELREAIGRSLALSTPGERPVALLVERSVPAADVAPVLRALVDLPTREIVVLLRSIRGVQLPEVPDPTAATARDIQVRAILASTHDRMARVHAMSALGPRLAVPAGTCPELDVALRSPASSLPDCRAAASDVAAVLRRCDLDDDATRRAATIVGLTWAPPETPPLATLRLSIGPGGRALAGPWEDLVHDLLSDERATVALP